MDQHNHINRVSDLSPISKETHWGYVNARSFNIAPLHWILGNLSCHWLYALDLLVFIIHTCSNRHRKKI